MRARLFAVGLVVAALLGCEPGPGAGPPPIIPNPPPVVPISQCKDVFPDTYTRPVPVGRPIYFLPATSDERKIMWLDRSCNYWYVGPYDPPRAPAFCAYRADLGDRYYASYDQGMFVGTPPLSCPA